jgi:hypothetical protein
MVMTSVILERWQEPPPDEVMRSMFCSTPTVLFLEVHLKRCGRSIDGVVNVDHRGFASIVFENHHLVLGETFRSKLDLRRP